MANGRNADSGREMMARALAEQAAKLAKDGRRKESERIFRKAFEQVREMKGPVGNLKNDVSERSKLATILADEAVSAGLSATFAVRMWKMGCNSDALDEDERGATQMFYPVEIMGMAMAERGKGGAEEDAPPAVACEAEAEGRLGIFDIAAGVGRFLKKVTGIELILGDREGRKGGA